LEGYRHVKEAIEGGLTPNMILMTRNAFESRSGEIISDLAKEHRITTEIVADGLFNAELADTVSSQGIVATFQKPPRVDTIDVALFADAPPLVVIMDGVADPGNLGR
jgi:tRNA G18 (ribose-2'-O)-methylase SpoU